MYVPCCFLTLSKPKIKLLGVQNLRKEPVDDDKDEMIKSLCILSTRNTHVELRREEV